MLPCKLRLWQHVDFDVDVCVDVHVDGYYILVATLFSFHVETLVDSW